MNPQGCRVVAFKQPTAAEAAHDFLWRVHQHAPAKGEVAIFNRSHYEDVLVVRVHKLVPKAVWSERYDQINELGEDAGRCQNTRSSKFFLYISKEEQLAPLRRAAERSGQAAGRSATPTTPSGSCGTTISPRSKTRSSITRTKQAPWYIDPSNHKWFRNLAVSQIVAATMAEMGLTLPPTKVDLEAIANKYHSALAEEHASKGTR